ncbi:aromatic acid exporter family protein [Paenibacillus eucommiae]|uniref:Uncharacterized membrane protein YgaE (UPF0421/DUF939 family) n=1 Tax=Paenibacillus eucommiae TaxID=1355755 RepID=A0ABS4IYQ7_9BACL|nr:aromatic acid exporter family protein [Paenibacillus eucommiae]MBP1992719.1 uncharacterized membrane protein YgaE (UPF0421/DUF939 family) [Paenibacillus eucommiae]
MTLGARVLKTGIAVTLSLYISELFGFSPAVIAAVAAIFAMQPSIYRSWRYFLEQLQTNTLGAILALLAGLIFTNQPIIVGLVCILVIMICLKINMEETIGLTLVTVIAVMEASGQWDFALNRFLQILIGIGSAFLINILFFPPKPKVQLLAQMQTVFTTLSLLLRTAISDEIKEKIFREEKKSLEEGLKSLEDKYKLLEEEQKKMKRAKYSHIRNLVVYKQMLHSLHKGLEILEAIEQHFFQAERTPEINAYFDHHLEQLIKYHEHVLLKFNDKLKSESSDLTRMEEANDTFMQMFMSLYKDSGDEVFRLSIVASVVYDYGFQTTRLDKLVEQYNKGQEA